MGTDTRPGPRAHYRPKSREPKTLTLTDAGNALLDLAADRCRASRADVVEQLLRRFGTRVAFPPEGPAMTVVTVTVDHPNGGQLVYEGISAIGVGHQKKHLVLVPAAGETVQVQPDDWVRFEAVKEEQCA